MIGHTPPIDEATAAFLRAASDDLQRQLGTAGRVDALEVAEIWAGVAVRARIRMSGSTITVGGSGSTVVDAYGDLVRNGVAEPTLAAAFRALLP
jgi:hypothetical protein